MVTVDAGARVTVAAVTVAGSSSSEAVMVMDEFLTTPTAPAVGLIESIVGGVTSSGSGSLALCPHRPRQGGYDIHLVAVHLRYQ